MNDSFEQLLHDAAATPSHDLDVNNLLARTRRRRYRVVAAAVATVVVLVTVVAGVVAATGGSESSTRVAIGTRDEGSSTPMVGRVATWVTVRRLPFRRIGSRSRFRARRTHSSSAQSAPPSRRSPGLSRRASSAARHQP